MATQEAFRLANRVLTLLAVLLGALVLLGVVFAGPLVAALAPGFEKEPGKAELTVLLTRVMMPFLPLVSFAAVAMGMLNAEERFGMPALSPALFNVVAIVWAAVLWAMGLPPEQVAIGWAIGTLLGGLAQFLVQVPSLWRLGWRFRPEWAPRDPGLLRMARPDGAGHRRPRGRPGQHLRQQHLRLAGQPAPSPGSTTPSACCTCRSACSASRSGRSPPPVWRAGRPRATWTACA